ncbi:MAG: FtsX-like permease family protein [Chloroflexi bacterium]|nr:FtsX-like permease family protein [Chloroflexota bacterium]
MLFAVTDRHDPAYQLRAGDALKSVFDDAGIGVGSIQTNASARDRIGTLFTILFTMLMEMTVLMATVGALGLMGTMSLNVLDRTREIGVLRAIGASNGTIQRIVIFEGVLIGVLSWAFSAALAYPLGSALASAAGMSMLQTPLEFVYSVNGAVLWLALVVVISAVASFMPAWSASHLTVREVLAYEG